MKENEKEIKTCHYKSQLNTKQAVMGEKRPKQPEDIEKTESEMTKCKHLHISKYFKCEQIKLSKFRYGGGGISRG